MESRNWIGGEWYTPTGGTMAVHNPSRTAEQLGTLYLSRPEDAVAAGHAARQALPKWAGMTGAARAEVLYKAAELFHQHLDSLARLASAEMGKPITEMRGEVMRAVHILRYYAAEGVRAIGSVIPANGKDVLQFTKRVPLGVVGVITPWNFPVAIPIWKIAPALICGNTVVWKPAEMASLTATRVTELLAEAGVPAGVLNLVIGEGATVGQALLDAVDLDGVSFTGSTTTGRKVAAACASRNIKYQTEMGGKNAAVVWRDADLAKTIPALISGAFSSAGQKCTATSRIIVDRACFDEVVARLADAIASIRVGPALEPETYMGPVASQAQYDKVTSYVRLAEQDGQVLARGRTDVDTTLGYYVLPMLATGVAVDHPLVQEEIFGPVATILAADSFEEAMALCNQTVYGLSASIFTQDLQKALRFLEEAEAGLVRVNLETAGVEYQSPFGGMKASSSHTREQGQAALEFYTQVKTCAVYYG
ncbi:putative aldehyde dehydrogenase YcbD [Alicyclobacillus cellulosilyticus]|uniref:Aldehyde dehydrogenase YcbD n=1 Tax=Alicyclobacillus cellulosilyticus TaxID=1003997 RepID=A0A917KH56_9BACL|nr:aldehyde dehydrogenase family protein [Alicyclobacillus cellulosilyticus]GGJ12125.1 putative aldehyde dehydrogenase YcbD [Alicyclobacillus cellulosilyticus]